MGQRWVPAWDEGGLLYFADSKDWSALADKTIEANKQGLYEDKS
jgi:hypothetical protein